MKRLLPFLLLAFPVFCLSTCVAAEEESIEVVATGIGKNSDDALKAALRAAVQQAVGTLVDTTTVIENDEVIEDKILGHSGAYVKRHELVGEPVVKGDMVEITIKASVMRTQLMSGLEAEKIRVTVVPAGNLGGEALTRGDAHKSGLELFQDALKGFPDRFVSFAVDGEPRTGKKGEKVIVPVRATVDREGMQAYIDRLADLLPHIAVEVKKKDRFPANRRKDGLHFKSGVFSTASSVPPMLSLILRINEDETLVQTQDFVLSKEMWEVLRKACTSQPDLCVELLDDKGEAIAKKYYNYPRVYRPAGVRLWILPFLGGWSNSSYALMPAEESRVFDIEFDLFADEIAGIKDIRLSLAKKP